MLKKIIFCLVVCVGVLNASGQICFKLEGKMGEEIKALLEKYKGSLEGVSIQNNGGAITTNADKLMRQVEAKIEAKRVKKIEDDKKAIAKQQIVDGKALFNKKCKICHGAKGEKEAYNKSRPLNTLALKEMQKAIVGYQLDQYDRGLSMIMKPYANSLMIEDVEAIYNYLKTLN
jgi:cytochrome c553